MIGFISKRPLSGGMRVCVIVRRIAKSLRVALFGPCSNLGLKHSLIPTISRHRATPALYWPAPRSTTKQSCDMQASV